MTAKRQKKEKAVIDLMLDQNFCKSCRFDTVPRTSKFGSVVGLYVYCAYVYAKMFKMIKQLHDENGS